MAVLIIPIPRSAEGSPGARSSRREQQAACAGADGHQQFSEQPATFLPLFEMTISPSA